MIRRATTIATATLVMFGALAPAWAGEGEHAYVGTNNCKKCHVKQWKSWKETKMAQAFEQLKPGVAAEAKQKAGLDPQKDYTTDPTCLACHTTGYGKPGGFVDIETTPDRAGVGCEMCHGPGGTYTQPNLMSLKNKEYKLADVEAAGLIAKPNADTCKVCHNSDSPFVGDDYVFDFEQRKAEGTHQHFPLKYKH